MLRNLFERQFFFGQRYLVFFQVALMCVCILHHSAGPHTRWAGAPSLEQCCRRIYRPGPCMCSPGTRKEIAWTGNKANLLRSEIAFFEPSAAHSTHFGERLTRPPTDHQMTFFSKPMKGEPRWIHIHITWAISDLNWVGSNDEWAFNVRRSHARFLFFSLTKLVLPHQSMTHSFEVKSSERDLSSRMRDRPSRKLVRTNIHSMLRLIIWCFVSVHSNSFFV